MKIRFSKDHLDFKSGKEYDVLDATATYLIRVGAAKEVVAKGKEGKGKVSTKELKTDIKTK